MLSPLPSWHWCLALPGITLGHVVATLLGGVWLPGLAGNDMRASSSTSFCDLHMSRLPPHVRQVSLPATATGRVDGLARVLATGGKGAAGGRLAATTSPAGIGLPPADSGARHRRGTATGAPEMTCRTVGDPVMQSVSDSRALLRTDDLSASAAARAVPLFCLLGPWKPRAREANATFQGCRSWTPRALIEEK